MSIGLEEGINIMSYIKFNIEIHKSQNNFSFYFISTSLFMCLRIMQRMVPLSYSYNVNTKFRNLHLYNRGDGVAFVIAPFSPVYKGDTTNTDTNFPLAAPAHTSG